jgi:hypothetical protein
MAPRLIDSLTFGFGLHGVILAVFLVMLIGAARADDKRDVPA